MTNETKNVPELRFPEFEGEWDEKELGEIGEKVKTKNKFEKFDETFTNSAEQGIVSQKEYFEKDISNSKNLSNYYVVENNDFVYNPRISNYAPVGPINRNKLKRTGVMSPLYTIFKMRKVDYTFCEYFFSSTKWHNFMKLNGDSGARSDRFSIKDSIFFKMPIKVPTNLEQQKIGDFFSKLDRQIELEEKKLALLEEQKKGYMQKIFSQELRFKDENGNDYPMWEFKKLGELYKVVMGQSPKGINYTDDNSYPVLVQGNADIYNGNIFPRIYTKEITKLVKKGDILLTVRAPVGEIGIAQFEACIGRGVCSIEGNKFIYYFLEMFGIQNKWQKLSQGSTFESISGSEVRNIEIPIPNSCECEKISHFFSELDHLINMHSQKVDGLKERKKGLLQKMFV